MVRSMALHAAKFQVILASLLFSWALAAAGTDSALSLQSNLNPSVFGQMITFSATASGTGAVPTGDVAYYMDNRLIGTATLSGGTATLYVIGMPGGSHSMNAVYEGDGTYNGSSSTALTQVVDPASTTIALASGDNPSVGGQSVTFTALVSAVSPGGGTPDGHVIFMDGAASLGTVTLSSGVARLSTSALTGGSHSITVQYQGTVSFSASTSATLDQIVQVSAATVTLGGLAATYDGSPHAATATTDPSGLAVAITYDGNSTAPTTGGRYAVAATITDPAYSGSASGTLVIAPAAARVTLGGLGASYDGNPHAATAATEPSGLAVTFTYNGSPTAPTAVGTYAVVATVDDPDYSGSATGTLVIARGTVSAVTLGGLSATYDGNPHAATATTVPAGLAVTFTYNGSSTAPTEAGSYTVVGTVDDGNYSGSATGTLVIAREGVGLLTLSCPGYANLGGTLTLTAAVSALHGTPTGSVTFQDGSTPLATQPITNGSASMVTSALALGSHTLSAAYQGDGNFLPGRSNVVPVEVAEACLVLAPSVSTVTLSPGGSASFQLSLSALGAVNGPIALSVDGLPPGACAEFSIASLDASSLPVTLTVRIRSSSGFQIAGNRTSGAGTGSGAFLLCGLLPLPFGWHRRRRGQAALLFAAGLLTCLIGCGGGASHGLTTATPSGTYAVTVRASAGGTSQSVTTVTLVVQ